jgi:GntP family gluconate:H+ symporter
MDPLLTFALTLFLITLAGLRFRISPFFTLIGGAMLFGLLAGMGPDQVLQEIVQGTGTVFAAFGIIILCGAIIAKLLHEQHQIEEIVYDIRRTTKRPRVIAGVSGYILAVPMTCCITAYVMLTPLLEHLEQRRAQQTGLLYLAAIGSILSYALIYPTPVVIPLMNAFGADTSPLLFNAITIPLSLTILAGLLIAARWWYAAPPEETSTGSALPADTDASRAVQPSGITGFHWRAWAPFLVIILMIPVSIFLLRLSHTGLINLIMLAGAVTALILARPELRTTGISLGAKHAGVIIFDICGAGAIGAVIVESGFAGKVLVQLSAVLPILLVPFFLAALIATAQGSRVVTAIITAQVLAGTGVVSAIHPIPLILMIGGGSCVVSYITDPFFWLVQKTTGDDLRTVVRNYTLPLVLIGITIFICALGLEVLYFR